MSVSIVCPNCGAVNQPMSAYCINCGNPLTASGVSLGGPTWVAPPSAPPGYPYGPPGYPAAPPTYPYYGPPRRTDTFSSIVEGLFRVWNRNFREFFLVYLALGLITAAISVGLSYLLFGAPGTGGGFNPIPVTPTSIDFGRLAVFSLAGVIASVVVSAIVQGGMTEFAVRRFRGEPFTPRQAIDRGVQKFLSILGASILYAFITFGLVLVSLLGFLSLIFGSGGLSGSAALAALCALAVGLLIGSIIALYVGVRLILWAPVIMMENAGAIAGLRRSWHIVKGHWGTVFLAGLIVGILSLIISGAITTAAGFANNFVVSVIASAIASAIVAPWSVALAAVAYDLLVRQPTPVYAPPPYYPGPAMPPPSMGQPPSSPPSAPPPGP